MTVCYECFEKAKLTELVIYEEDGNWKLGCVRCAKPKKLYDVSILELREVETK